MRGGVLFCIFSAKLSMACLHFSLPEALITLLSFCPIFNFFSESRINSKLCRQHRRVSLPLKQYFPLFLFLFLMSNYTTDACTLNKQDSLNTVRRQLSSFPSQPTPPALEHSSLSSVKFQAAHSRIMKSPVVNRSPHKPHSSKLLSHIEKSELQISLKASLPHWRLPHADVVGKESMIGFFIFCCI